MLLFHAPLISTHFWPASTLLRGHLALATLSLLVNEPQILERWGYADEDHLGKKSERRILVSNFSVTRNSFCEFYTLELVSACLCTSREKTSAASCPEIRNPIAVHQKIDV